MGPLLLRGKELSRQRAFLEALLDVLTRRKRIASIWLTGSLAAIGADRWSSVDLLLVWHRADRGSMPEAPPSETIREALKEVFGEGRFFSEHESSATTEGKLGGIGLACEDSGHLPRDHEQSGVLFEISWTPETEPQKSGSRRGPMRLLYTAKQQRNGVTESPGEYSMPLGPPDADAVENQLARFWLLLARLPAVVKRQEALAAHALLTNVRILLIDLVVALNGADRPQTAARINQYLGPAQIEAFEKSLGRAQVDRNKTENDRPNWIGQAVSLVVLYRWYAPQLVEKYQLNYPMEAERVVLESLSAELEQWPDQISTG